jgi:hypothetical protein
LAVEKAWKNAGEGSIPVFAAAFITNAAYQSIEALDDKFAALLGGSNPEALLSRYQKILESWVPTYYSSERLVIGSACSEASPIEGYQQPWASMIRFKET